MKKTEAIVTALLLLAIMSMAFIVIPVYATITPVSIETPITFQIDGAQVEAKRIDTFQFDTQFIQIQANIIINGTRISINSTKYPLAKLYQAFSANERAKSTATQKTDSLSKSSDFATSSSIPTYWWNGFQFVRAPGDAYTYIKYDHPNNLADIGLYYPGQYNLDYTLTGSVYCYHLSEAAVRNAILKSTFATLASFCVPIIAGLLLVPELISKFAAALIALFGAVCALFGYTARWFIENIIQTEVNDGWLYSWGHTCHRFLWWVFGYSWWISFGSLRDWGFFIYVPTWHGGGGILNCHFC